MIPLGSDAISPAPHHDIYSIEDLRQLVYSLKEASRYTKPVIVKIAAVHNVAAIASGMGWYSLAGATISQIGGSELGSVAFLSNLMREIFSFIIIPVVAIKLNYYTCIAPAGATSEDTTLPVMLKYTNEETVVLSVLNGIICSFFVPILISLCFTTP